MWQFWEGGGLPARGGLGSGAPGVEDTVVCYVAVLTAGVEDTVASYVAVLGIGG